MNFDVVMLTSAHAATDDRIFYREAKTLVEAGQAVCVVGRHPTSEILEGIHIRALGATKSRLRRLLLGVAILDIACELKARLYIIHDPELIAIALLLRLLGKRVVYDAHENLPSQIRQKDWIPTPLRWVLAPAASALEWVASRLLSGVIAAVPAIQVRFRASHTELVRNFPTRSALATLAEGPPISTRANVVIYTGGLSRIRGIRELVEAFRGLDGAQLWLVGSFDDTGFQKEITSSLPHNVLWLGWSPHPEVLKLYRMAKLGAVVLYSTPNHRCALPVKLFEYLGAGLPTIISDFPEYKEFVLGCGIAVDPQNVTAIRSAVSLLLGDDAMLTEMSVRARQRVVASFSWENEGTRLVEFCTKIMTGHDLLPGAMVRDSPRQLHT
jgi:glycosyltransferase involved in cell wall biosynthesis